MKRFFTMMLAVTMVATMSACGGEKTNTDNQESGVKESGTQEVATDKSASAEITLETLKNHPVSPAEDFRFMDDGKGGRDRAHDLLLRSDIPLLEMITNLNALSADVCFLMALPGLNKVEGLDASPAQVVALEGFEVI